MTSRRRAAGREPGAPRRSPRRPPRPGLTAARAVLEASVGDWLHTRGLGSDMAVVRHGRKVALDGPSLRRAFRRPSARLTVWVHGLGVTERAWTFHGYSRKSYGTLHAAEAGYTPVFVRYNTGRRIADSGHALDDLLDRLVARWPVPVVEMVLIGYSMGGLVVRSACHHGASGVRRGSAWSGGRCTSGFRTSALRWRRRRERRPRCRGQPPAALPERLARSPRPEAQESRTWPRERFSRPASGYRS